MLKRLLDDERLAHIMDNAMYEVIAHLLETEQEFGIICDTAHVTFDPALPEDTRGVIKAVSLFMVAGYSFESAGLDEHGVLHFEAGFGPDNFGSLVSVPIDQITQIIVQETPVFLNITAGSRRRYRDTHTLKTDPHPEPEPSDKHSFGKFLSNPENSRFFQK